MAFLPVKLFSTMKKFCLLLAALTCMIQTQAQDAPPNQPKGTWYFDLSDATEVFRIFSAEGATISPSIGYTIADNLMLKFDFNSIAVDDEINFNFGAGVQRFFGNNFYYSGQVDLLGDTFYEEFDLGLELGIGKFISVTDRWFITPQLSSSVLTDEWDDVVRITSLNIRFGARF